MCSNMGHARPCMLLPCYAVLFKALLSAVTAACTERNRLLPPFYQLLQADQAAYYFSPQVD